MAVHAHVRIVYLKFPLSSGQFKRFELGVNNIHVVCRWIHIVAAWCPPIYLFWQLWLRLIASAGNYWVVGTPQVGTWEDILVGNQRKRILPVSSIASIHLDCWRLLIKNIARATTDPRYWEREQSNLLIGYWLQIWRHIVGNISWYFHQPESQQYTHRSDPMKGPINMIWFPKCLSKFRGEYFYLSLFWGLCRNITVPSYCHSGFLYKAFF